MESFFKWNTIYRLIAVEVVVFLAINLLVLLVPGIDFDTFFRDGFPLAAKASGMELIKRPWTILTHLFVHNGFAHILWNMIILAIAGNIFVRYLGNKKSLSVFLFSGVFALLVVTLIGTFNTKVDVLQPYLGSSAAVLGVLIASATYAPNHPMTLFLVGIVARF